MSRVYGRKDFLFAPSPHFAAEDEAEADFSDDLRENSLLERPFLAEWLV